MAIPPSELDARYARLGATTGRRVKENGEFVNEADITENHWLANIGTSSREGTVFRSFWDGVIPIGETYVFCIIVPPGIDLYGLFRETVVEEGQIRASFAADSDPGTATGEGVGPFNFNNVDGQAAQCTFDRVTSPGPYVVHTAPRLITAPSTGPIRQPSAQTAAQAQVKHDADVMPFFVLENVGGVDAPCQVTVFWQELPKP